MFKTMPKSRMFSFENVKGMRMITMDTLKAMSVEGRFRVFSG